MARIRSTWRVLNNIVWMPEYVMGIDSASLEEAMKDETQRLVAQIRYPHTPSVKASNGANN